MTKSRRAPRTSVAASFGLSKTLTLDAGFARSLRPGISDRNFFTGLTVLGLRLF